MIVLADGQAQIDVHPEAGAAIGRYDVTLGGDPRAVFQTAPSPERSGPFALGCNLLVPYSNRISGGGFRHEGKFHPLERNTADPYPIHGNGFALPWTIREQTANRAVLGLASDGPGPFRYEAVVAYTLNDGALEMRLTVWNRATFSLPFGAGFHPWFVRTPGTRLTMRTQGFWTETVDHLPDAYVPTAGADENDFSAAAALPDTFVNNAFTGWDGHATIAWADRGLAVDIAALPPLTTAILYSPSGGANYVCLEPVSHSVDAHNRSEPGTARPQALEPGEGMVVETTIRPYTL